MTPTTNLVTITDTTNTTLQITDNTNYFDNIPIISGEIRRGAAVAAPAAVAGLGTGGDIVLGGAGFLPDLDCGAGVPGCDCVVKAVSDTCVTSAVVTPANNTSARVVPMIGWQPPHTFHHSSSFHNHVLTTWQSGSEEEDWHGAVNTFHPTHTPLSPRLATTSWLANP